MGLDALQRSEQTGFIKRLVFFMFLGLTLMALNILFHFHRSIALEVFSPFIIGEAVQNRLIYAANVISDEFERLTLLSLLILLLILSVKRRLINSSVGAIFLCALLLIDLTLATTGAIRRDESIYPWIEKIREGLDSTIGRDKSVHRVGSHAFALSPNLEMYLGYQTVGGFTALFPTRYYEYINKYSENKLPEGWQCFYYGIERNSILMDLLNVKYGIFHDTRRYENRKSHLPRAFIVYLYERIEKKQVLNRLTSPDFDPTKKILFEKEENPPHLLQDLFRTSLPVGRAKIISYRPDQIMIETESPEAGLLFLSEIYYPGWKASVDGQPREILRGNYLFRAIEIPGGNHVVHFFFDPLSIKLGICGTLLTLFILFVVISRHYWKNTHSSKTKKLI
jgi:hypothetical protein